MFLSKCLVVRLCASIALLFSVVLSSSVMSVQQPKQIGNQAIEEKEDD